jgi:hypothetical protein
MSCAHRPIKTQKRTCLTMSSFFVDIHNTSDQNGCCDDRLNLPIITGQERTPNAELCGCSQGWVRVGGWASKRLFDGLFDTEVCRVDHVVAKVGCRVFDVLTNRDAVNVALNLGCGVLEVVVDQPGGATG